MMSDAPTLSAARTALDAMDSSLLSSGEPRLAARASCACAI